ncbi:transmembrane protein 176A [Rhynchonycteris naso]
MLGNCRLTPNHPFPARFPLLPRSTFSSFCPVSAPPSFCPEALLHQPLTLKECRRMSVGMVMAAGGEAAPGGPEPTHIHVHIHQEPMLSLSSCPPPPAFPTLGSRRLLAASWVVQIVAGLLSGVLGVHGFVILYYNNGFSYLLHIWKAGIWTGVVAVLAGVTAFIYEKRGGIFWALLRTLLALAAFAATIAAIYFGAYYFQDLRYTFRDEFCGFPESWEPTLPLSPPEKAMLCLSYLHMLMERDQKALLEVSET